MHIRRTHRATALVVLLAATLMSCSGADPEPRSATPPRADTAPSSPPTKAAAPIPEAPTSTLTPAPVKVRDAFATLQATLNDDCVPGNCDYFLGRVHDELTGLESAMKADPKGPSHFDKPLAWTANLWKTLGDDRSTPNLEKNRTDLIGTRDKINAWMQNHPDDYR
ncbi:hypothetical protein OG875_20350 [Streptomyces sp. NBC_01498]|uniref:hypothetical protein n=1 Tax=Streptomyces sp. NBC_01498 TaxID=2975870 RepID=UPI002E7B2D5B|nr:hypothetical protein [Streptomyces sp. NBC_01498]WTL26705.1 hypothetical protein OG875_20350 [Streptomyces sp. NBC_01498]